MSITIGGGWARGSRKRHALDAVVRNPMHVTKRETAPQSHVSALQGIPVHCGIELPLCCGQRTPGGVNSPLPTANPPLPSRGLRHIW
eukprot:3931651-Pyramimonas_sp.AAC.1